MVKKLLFLFIFFIISIVFLSATSNVLAVQRCYACTCTPGQDTCDKGPNGEFNDCLFWFKDKYDTDTYRCQPAAVGAAFGKIQIPDALKGFLAKDPTGAGAISQFLSNGVVLIYSLASIVLIFMLLWGAFDWMTSGGDKEKIAAARSKIINAIIGIILFAVAFAVIQVLGTFTGFKFFAGQK